MCVLEVCVCPGSVCVCVCPGLNQVTLSNHNNQPGHTKHHSDVLAGFHCIVLYILTSSVEGWQRIGKRKKNEQLNNIWFV